MTGRALLAALTVLIGSGAWNANASAQVWIQSPTVPYMLNNKQDALAFADAKTGWYGNGTGRVYQTKNAALEWKQVWSRPGTYVRALEFVDRKTGFLGNIGGGYYPNISDKQPLYVTHDGGANWTPVIPVEGKQIVGVCAIDVLKIDGKVAAVRAGGRVGGPAAMLESFDEGRTFRARDMSSVTGMILDIHFVDANTGFIAGASLPSEEKAHARILKTTDGGQTWRAVFESDLAGSVNWKLSFPTAQIGYATIISYQSPDNEARGYVAKTEDGGETWLKSTVTQDKDWVPYGISFKDADHGWVGGSTGGYETRDGGKTWTAVKMGASVNKIRLVSREDGGTTAFAIGQDIYRLELPVAR